MALLRRLLALSCDRHMRTHMRAACPRHTRIAPAQMLLLLLAVLSFRSCCCVSLTPSGGVRVGAAVAAGCAFIPLLSQSVPPLPRPQLAIWRADSADDRRDGARPRRTRIAPAQMLLLLLAVLSF